MSRPEINERSLADLERLLSTCASDSSEFRSWVTFADDELYLHRDVALDLVVLLRRMLRFAEVVRVATLNHTQAHDQLEAYLDERAAKPRLCLGEGHGDRDGPTCKRCGFCPVHAYEANRQGEGVCGECMERAP